MTSFDAEYLAGRSNQWLCNYLTRPECGTHFDRWTLKRCFARSYIMVADEIASSIKRGRNADWMLVNGVRFPARTVNSNKNGGGVADICIQKIVVDSGLQSNRPCCKTSRPKASAGGPLIGMVVGFLRARGGEARDPTPGAGAPIVRDLLRENPRRNFHFEALRESVEVRFIHPTKFRELLVQAFIVSKVEPGLRERSAQALQIRIGQAIWRVTWSGAA